MELPREKRETGQRASELSPSDRSLITVAALIAGGKTLKEVIIYLAFSAGWPRAMPAVQVAKRVFES